MTTSLLPDPELPWPIPMAAVALIAEEGLRYLRAVALAARTAADVGAALLPQEGEA